MSIVSAFIQGLIQGLTEFLPVSSSGHLSLWQYFTGQSGQQGVLFSVLLHLGTLLAVFIAFYKTIFALIAEVFYIFRDIFTGKFSFKNSSPNRRMIFLLIVSLLPMFGTLFIMDIFDAMATDNSIIAEGVCFLVTSILLFICTRCVKGHKTAQNMRYTDAVAIGVAQALAPFPGVSRSGSTIAAGLVMGLDKEFAVAFSFIMGIPTILAANVLQVGDAVASGVSIPMPVIAVGVATSLVFGLISIKLVRWLVASNRFIIFAWYTFILGVFTIAIGVFELSSDHLFQQLIAMFIN